MIGILLITIVFPDVFFSIFSQTPNVLKQMPGDKTTFSSFLQSFSMIFQSYSSLKILEVGLQSISVTIAIIILGDFNNWVDDPFNNQPLYLK